MERIIKTAIILIALVVMQIFYMSGPVQVRADSGINCIATYSGTLVTVTVPSSGFCTYGGVNYTSEFTIANWTAPFSTDPKVVGSLWTYNITANPPQYIAPATSTYLRNDARVTIGTGGAVSVVIGTTGTQTPVSLGTYDNYGYTMVGSTPSNSSLTARYIINEPGATLKGYGRITGSITNKPGATFKVGGSPGTLFVEGDVILQGETGNEGSIWFTVAGSKRCSSESDCKDGYSWLDVDKEYHIVYGGDLNILLMTNTLPGSLDLFDGIDPPGEHFDNINIYRPDGNGGVILVNSLSPDLFDTGSGILRTSVPEPSTMLLLGFGLVGLTLISRKYKIG